MSMAVKDTTKRPANVKQRLKRQRDELLTQLHEVNRAIQKADTGTDEI